MITCKKQWYEIHTNLYHFMLMFNVSFLYLSRVQLKKECPETLKKHRFALMNQCLLRLEFNNYNS